MDIPYPNRRPTDTHKGSPWDLTSMSELCTTKDLMFYYESEGSWYRVATSSNTYFALTRCREEWEGKQNVHSDAGG